MKRLLVVVDPKNRYLNALYWGNELIATGNSGLESVAVESNGAKRTLLRIGLASGFNVVFVQDDCQEAYRYASVCEALGDRTRIMSLNPACEMLRISPNACDGCPRRPDQLSQSTKDQVRR